MSSASNVIRIFIGYEGRQAVAFHVLAHSIIKRARQPVSITPLVLDQLPLNRPRDPLQSTEFAFSRFLVPYLCNYEGHAIYLDCDMLVMADIAGLWSYRAENAPDAVHVVKHRFFPREPTKFEGEPQAVYPRKNWSSVMLFNCARCRQLTPQVVNGASGLTLHRFHWLDNNSRIGDLPLEWNFLVGYNNEVEDTGEFARAHEWPKAKLLHWTDGGPWWEAYRNVDGAADWRYEFHELVMGC